MTSSKKQQTEGKLTRMKEEEEMQQGKEFWGKLQNSFSLALIKIASVEKEHGGGFAHTHNNKATGARPANPTLTSGNNCQHEIKEITCRRIRSVTDSY